jgi:hypothetical protein
LGDFITATMRETNGKVSVQGYGGSKTKVTHTSTIKWRVVDDLKTIRDITLSGSLYIPGCPTKLLSSQHDSPGTPLHQKTRATTYSDCLILQWTKNAYKCTIPLDA